MNRATPPLRDVAARLIACEAMSAPDMPSLFQVCEKLRPHLATLMGQAGFQAVLARALAVTRPELPWLTAVRVKPDGSLEGWDKASAQVPSKELAASGVLLIAQLLGQLVAFIGDNLTLRLVREVWPQLSLEDLKCTEGDHP